jgi:motility quorum-sensing regulator / GCU-specific mRNA interferase toxin
VEKRRPTYDLEAVKLAFATPDGLAITISALKHATALGYDRSGIVTVIAA